LPLVAALNREMLRNREMAADLVAGGRASAHPDVAAASARADALALRAAEQLALERRANDALVVALESAARDASAPRVEWDQRLARLDAAGKNVAAGVTSDDPPPLLVLAMEDAVQRADIAALSLRYGAAHPRMVVAEERLDAIARAFVEERDALHRGVEDATTMGSPVVTESDRRPGELLEEAGRLGALLARLDAWKGAVREQAHVVKVIEPCAAR
jgi:hypothetical protein